MLTERDAPHMPVRVLGNMLVTLAYFVALSIVAVGIAGCVVPTKMQLDPVSGIIATTEVGYAAPGTGSVMVVADLDTSGAERSWLSVLVTGAALIGGFQFVGPKSWANWINVLRPGSSWSGTLKSLGSLTGFTRTPKEAEAFVAEKAPAVAVLTASPDRTDP